jgi:geranylgeranylglycerol-phosphate geranylgeranyltransferase
LNKRVKGFLMLLRPTYWLMTGGLSILTALVLKSGAIDAVLFAEIFASMAFIVSGGFAINDYFDEKTDAVVKPNRPIPSGIVSPRQAIMVSAVMFASGLVIAFLISFYCFALLLFDSLLLLFYSAFLKKWSGTVANMAVGLLIATSFLYGELAAWQIITIASISLAFTSFGSVGGNVLRDVLSLEGDMKIKYPTMPKEIGVKTSVEVGATFLLLSALCSPFPYVVGAVRFSYLPLIAIWDAAIFYSSIILFRNQDVSNVKRQERIMTMSMILLPLAMIAGVYI